ncbi:MAG TPA: hypothetical protein VMT18_05680, partial [Planctomycetota bacterium]|nr:hypothetical protein [Planctomycetota bacterium]
AWWNENDVSGRLAALETELAQLPGVDALQAFGGRDLALAGRFRGADLAATDWAVYGRVNWMGKLAASALAYPGLLGLEQQGLSADVDDGLITLTGARLARPLHVTRVNDVVVVGTSLELVRAARELDARAGQDSFGQSAVYFDTIENAGRGARRDELELFLDWRTLAEQGRHSGRWPDAEAPDMGTRLAARLFQLGALKELSGVVGFDRGLAAHLVASLSSEMVTPLQTRLYRRRGIDRQKLGREVAALAPADTGLFAYLEIGLGDLLREVLATSEPALRSNLDDVLRSTGAYTGAEALIEELDGLFQSGVGLIVRQNDYRTDPEKDPPHDGQPAFAFSVVLWTDGSEKARTKIDELQKLIVRNQQSLGLSGRNPNQPGVFHNEVKSGHMIWEFWSPFITGTGHLATVVDDRRFILSNNFRMLDSVIATFYAPRERRVDLGEDLDFKGLVGEGLPQANLVAWYAPPRLGPTVRAMAATRARNDVLGGMDMARERVREEALVLRQEFNGLTLGQLGPDERTRLDALVDERMSSLQERLMSSGIPERVAAYERQQDVLEHFDAALLMVAFDPKQIELSLGAVTASQEP